MTVEISNASPRIPCRGSLDIELKTVFQIPDVFQNRFRRFGRHLYTSLLCQVVFHQARIPVWPSAGSDLASDWRMEGLCTLMHGILLMILQIIPQLERSMEGARIGAVVRIVP